jgi:plasmid stabilization system protein ParE
MEQLAEFFEAARKEFDEAFDWYSKRSHGAAIGFASAVDAALDAILADPGRFPRTFAGCQYGKVDRYPYQIVYYRDERGVVVVAVAHAKRRPGYWRRRLSTR